MSSKTEDQLLDDLTDFVSPRTEQVLKTSAKFADRDVEFESIIVPLASPPSPCTLFLLVVSPVIALCLLMVAAMALNAMFGLIIYPLSLLWNPLPNDAVKLAFGLGVPVALLAIYSRCRAEHKALNG